MLHLTGAQANAHSELAKLTIFGEAEGSSVALLNLLPAWP